MPFDGYFESLYKLAAKRPVSEFKQGQHVGDAPQRVTEKLNKLKNRGGQEWSLPIEIYTQVKGGFCHGASLEWLRKVLQREDKKSVDHLKQSRVLRMTQTHLRHKGVDLNSLFDGRTAPLKSQRDELQAQRAALGSRIDGLGLPAKEAAYKALKQDFDAWAEQFTVTDTDGRACYQGSTAVIAAIREKQLELKRVRDALQADIAVNDRLVGQGNDLVARQDGIQERINALVREFDAMSTLEARASLWNEIAEVLDAGSGKKRKFSGIVPVSSSRAETFVGVREFLQSALSSPEFLAGRGMLVSMNLVPEPGHAIALHRDSADTVLLFDPNLGVYKFSRLTLLVLALIVLMEIGYAGKDSKGKVTELGSKHSWQVFARTQALIPAPGRSGLGSREEIGLACDASREILATAREMAESLLETSLVEAERCYRIYDKEKGPDRQAQWIEAHNEAVASFRRMRGLDMAELKKKYSEMDNVTYNLR